jgi:hypothetical protein
MATITAPQPGDRVRVVRTGPFEGIFITIISVTGFDADRGWAVTVSSSPRNRVLDEEFKPLFIVKEDSGKESFWTPSPWHKNE